MLNSIICLGRDYQDYGQSHSESNTYGSAVAISVGADKASPSLKYKGGAVLNEDALCLVESPSHVLLAVADAHFGESSSHVLISTLKDLTTSSLGSSSFSQKVEGSWLAGTVSSLCGHGRGSSSATTFLLALLCKETRVVSYVSYGDSSLLFLPMAGGYRLLNQADRDNCYVSFHEPHCRPLRQPVVQSVTLKRPGLLTLFTDGVDECCYRQPDRSIRPWDIEDLAASVGDRERSFEFCQRLVNLALEGVRGQPGGQDNIAIVATEL